MQASVDTNPLPIELTTFIGRKQEVPELIKLLTTTRLLTLTGPGGSGKTRLGLEVVRQIRAERASLNVVWVELASLDDPGHIGHRIAAACGTSEELRVSDPASLARALGGGPRLIVLDNCEHIVDACASFAQSLLQTSPDIGVLATSREALGIKGERAWLVPPLPSADAIQLFVERARDFSGEFEITEQNASAVADICARLDGIPLAIELAASRVKVLTPEQIRDRLDDAFHLLRSSSRTVIPRHRTLEAAIDWSYELLSEDERILFRRLAPFRGGFTLDAVEAVGAGDALDSSAVLDLLTGLVDRSLVLVREQAGVARYTLLETVLQYARRKLAASGEQDTVQRRHAQYVVSLVAAAEPHLAMRPERPIWVARFSDEMDNIREALAWSRNSDPDLHVRLASMLWWFWYSTRYWTEAAQVLRSALELPAAAAPTRDRAKLLFGAGALASLQGKFESARLPLTEAVDIALACGDEHLLAYARTYLGMTYAGIVRIESKQLCEEAAEWFERNNEPSGQRLALLLLGTTALNQGAFDESIALMSKAVQIARAFQHPRELSIALATNALPHSLRGEYDRARELLLESLSAARRDPSYFAIAMALDTLAEGAGHQGRPLDAARWFGAAENLRVHIGATAHKFSADRVAAAVKVFRAAAGDDAFDRAWAAGRQLDVDAIMTELLGPPSPVTTVMASVSPPAGAGVNAKLRVHALGPLRVSIEGAEMPPEAWAYAKPKELLVYLLCHPAGSTRDAIARALWPTAAPAQLKNSFHVTLHHLRKALGHADWIVVDADRYRIAPSLTYEFDAAVFEAAARDLEGASIERLRGILALYRGCLLEGEVTGDWIEESASRLRRLYVEASLALGAALESADDVKSAIDVYQQIIARDDLEEEAYRRVMLCYSRLGDRPRALKYYERLGQVLRTTLDAEPEAETIAVFERIRAGQHHFIR